MNTKLLLVALAALVGALAVVVLDISFELLVWVIVSTAFLALMLPRLLKWTATLDRAEAEWKVEKSSHLEVNIDCEWVDLGGHPVRVRPRQQIAQK